MSHLLNLQCTGVGHKEKRCHYLLANALKMEFGLYFNESRSNVGHCVKEVSKMWLYLVHFWSNEGPFSKNRIMTYISMKVGHSNLNLDMEVNVIYRCHMSLQSWNTSSNKYHLLANALKMEFDLYIHESRSQWPNSSNLGQCDLEVSKMSNTFDIWPFLVKWGSI